VPLFDVAFGSISAPGHFVERGGPQSKLDVTLIARRAKRLYVVNFQIEFFQTSY
jgi:hypothetical protein